MSDDAGGVSALSDGLGAGALEVQSLNFVPRDKDGCVGQGWRVSPDGRFVSYPTPSPRAGMMSRALCWLKTIVSV